MRHPAWFMKRTRLLEILAMIVCSIDMADPPESTPSVYPLSPD